ncbi:MAG: trypsin-like peptidase domain-containing protein [Eubacterium sp.]
MNNQFTNHQFTKKQEEDVRVESTIEFIENEDKNKRKKSFNLTKKTGALLMTGGIVLSGMFGFGGGMLANEITGNSGKPVMYQSIERTGATDETTTNTGTMTIQQIAKTAANSVVEIRTEIVTGGSRVQQAVSEGAGSGVIVTNDGYIVTNNHVIDGASKITVKTKNGESYKATLVGTDPTSDVALLKIDAKDLQPAVMGDSGKLTVGEQAVAIGNPLGELGGTVTDGIISALDREITLDGDTMNLLQTNAAINPGNSGGGLFNEYGELVGIVVAKSSGTGVEGLGFAIPINDVKSVVESLSNYGYVKGRVSLGVSLVDVDSAEKAMQYRVSEMGVYVAEVTDNSGASAAGIKTGDRIVSVDGTEVSTSADVKQALKKHKVGDQTQIEIKRDKGSQTLTATLGEQEATTN